MGSLARMHEVLNGLHYADLDRSPQLTRNLGAPLIAEVIAPPVQVHSVPFAKDERYDKGQEGAGAQRA